jgi:hypothetical protein
MINVGDVKELLGTSSGPWVSIYLPTHRHAPGTAQDPIRYRGLVDQARELLAGDVDKRVAKALTDVLAALDSPEFWNHQLDGLAVFCAPDHQAFYRLPVAVPELVVVGPTPHTKPLVRHVSSNRRYFALVLSAAELALYEGTQSGVDPVDLEGVPTSLAEALGFRSRGRVDFSDVSKGWRPVFRAAGAGDEAKKDALEEYFRRVDRALLEVFADDRAPIVLGGVRYLQDIFRAVSKNPHLIDEGATGSFDQASANEIHAATWPIVQARVKSYEDETIAEYRAAAARGRGSDELETVGHAVAHGRVRTLLLSAKAELWGNVDPDTGEIDTHDQQQGAADVDVHDELGEMTLVRGGEVLVLEPDRMPTKNGCAAIFRY